MVKSTTMFIEIVRVSVIPPNRGLSSSKQPTLVKKTSLLIRRLRRTLPARLELAAARLHTIGLRRDIGKLANRFSCVLQRPASNASGWLLALIGWRRLRERPAFGQGAAVSRDT